MIRSADHRDTQRAKQISSGDPRRSHIKLTIEWIFAQCSSTRKPKNDLIAEAQKSIDLDLQVMIKIAMIIKTKPEKEKKKKEKIKKYGTCKGFVELFTVFSNRRDLGWHDQSRHCCCSEENGKCEDWIVSLCECVFVWEEEGATLKTIEKDVDGDCRFQFFFPNFFLHSPHISIRVSINYGRWGPH